MGIRDRLHTAALVDALCAAATAAVAFLLTVVLRPFAVGVVSIGEEIVGYTPASFVEQLLIAGLPALLLGSFVAWIVQRRHGRRIALVALAVSVPVYTYVLYAIRGFFAI